MKSKILVSSILTIVLCFSLIVGSTFALFTSEDEFDISITSGKVNIDATASIVGVYSAKGDPAGDLEDENGAKYIHEGPFTDNTFTNGGTAAMDGANLVIKRLTPGDKVVLNVAIDNKSNVAIKYRYKIVVAEGAALASGMVVTVDDVAYKGVKSFGSAWIAAEGNAAIADKEIAIELPIAAGNGYQDLAVTYTVIVEAVQGNGVVANEDEVEYALYSSDNDVVDKIFHYDNAPSGNLNTGLNPTGGIVSGTTVTGTNNGKGFRALYVTNLTQDLVVLDSTFAGTYAMNVNASGIKDYGIYAANSTFNGWTSYGSAKEVVFTNCSFGEAEGYANLRPYVDTTLTGCDFADGFTITRDSVDNKTFTITLDNCTVNGVAVTADNFADLLTGGDLTSEYALATSANITVLVDGVTVDWN